VSDEIPVAQSPRATFALGTVLVGVGCWLIGQIAARLSGSEAVLLITGTALALASFYAAWRVFKAPAALSASRAAATRPPDLSGSPHAPVADDLNQALCAITANADAIERLIARQQPDLEEVRAALADIVDDAARASRTLQLAEASPLLAAATDDIDVAQLVDQFVHQLRGELASHDVICEVETAAHLPGIRGSREPLLQVFTRLMIRMLEAMPGQERRLRVRASRHNRSVAISIEDSGAAIRPESAARLCDPSCRRIVQAHGGHIAVTRAAGGGAALQVILPASS
jgi:C4-dicarboxylate-specific signal transduction histidine kinase